MDCFVASLLAMTVGCTTNKKPGLSTGLSVIQPVRTGLRRLVRNGCVVTVGVGLVAFTIGLRAGFGLGAAARALGELALDFLDRFGLRRMLDDGDFARQAIERCFIELAFAVGLFGLRFRAIEIAHHFGDRNDVTGIDLGFVFLRPARPHRAFYARTAFEGFQGLLD